MRLLRLALESQRWDLAAHTLILAAAKLLDNGEKLRAGQSREKKGCSQGQPKR